MSDSIKHECGLALIRLLKPLSYYEEKYGTSLYGLNKLQLLMQKQRNRGQDGAGIATIKLDAIPGKRYISRKRSVSAQYLKDLFEDVRAHFNDLKPEQLHDPIWLKNNVPYTGELLLGHLRYGTHGDNTIETCHPFLRQSNYISRNLILAGNFNLTNVEELFQELISYGQLPKEKSDTVTVLEKIGHFLDDEVQRLFNWFKPDGYSNQQISALIAEHLDIQRMLQRAIRKFDGGYVMAGMIGHGDAFVLRDEVGIRPAYYYFDDEIVVAASERPAIQTVLDVPYGEVKELERGHALIIKKSGEVRLSQCKDQAERKACSFERIYFSRGTDKEIYHERKKLGELLAKPVLEAIDYDFENTIFSFIPNTAESSFFGLIKGLEDELNKIKKAKILELGDKPDSKAIEDILSMRFRAEKIAVKDEKLRTFIADDKSRDQLVSHVYDVTYGVVRNKIDNLVLIDDSIVRGTTLRDSILMILSRLKPKRIIILSSAPQIRYPDCYGIDMSVMKKFAAFEALVTLLKENGKEKLLEKAYKKCLIELKKPSDEMINVVKDLYEEFEYTRISQKIAEMLTPKNIIPQVDIIFQTIEDLHIACPNHTGDWYFSGDYPTPGGNKAVNIAFSNFIEGNDARAY